MQAHFQGLIYILFAGMFTPLAFVTGLQSHHFFVCLHSSHVTAVIFPTAKVLKAVAEILAATDATPSVVVRSPAGNNP